VAPLPLLLVMEVTTTYPSSLPAIAQAIMTSLSPLPPIIKTTSTWNETKFFFPYLWKIVWLLWEKEFKHHICDIWQHYNLATTSIKSCRILLVWTIQCLPQKRLTCNNVRNCYYCCYCICWWNRLVEDLMCTITRYDNPPSLHHL